MGGGSWTTSDYKNYTTTRGITTDRLGNIDSSYRVQDLYKSTRLNNVLDPKNAMRECVDSEEHPNTIPVILSLDVTGSMGKAAEKIAQLLNSIMTDIFSEVKDVEFLIMGIGDMMCDDAPVQASQFESDIRIADQLEKVYFEFGGGGNNYESYTAAWYFGLNHTKLDCWNRGKKGIIITIGDETINPYLPKHRIKEVFGDDLQADVETPDLYKDTSEKFDIYHIAVSDTNTYRRLKEYIQPSFGRFLDENHLITSSCDAIASTITDIVKNAANSDNNFVVSDTEFTVNQSNEISW